MSLASSHFRLREAFLGLPQEYLRRSYWANVAMLFVIALVVMARQFTHASFASCVIDDSILQISWVRQFTQVLSEGTFLPKWLPSSNGGDGSPVFVFYAPFVYYLTAVAQALGGSAVFSMKLIRFLALWLSGVSMFFAMLSLLGRRSSFLASLAYLLLPFHVLDVTYWTLYAEPWAWVWFPLIIWSLIRLTAGGESQFWGVVATALSFALLILTHLVSAYMFSFVMLTFVWFWSNGSNRWRNLMRLVIAASIGLGLAAFYLLPACYERRFVHLEYSTLLPEFNFRNTFLFFPSPELMIRNAFQSRTIVLLRWLTTLQLIALLISAVGATFSDSDFKHRRFAWFATAVAAATLFLMSTASSWVWDWIPGLPQIQFSTRWLSIFTMAVSLLVGLACRRLLNSEAHSRPKHWWGLLALTCFVCCLFADILLVSSNCFVTPEEIEKAEAGLYNAPEYNPLAMQNWRERVIPPETDRWWLLEGTATIEMVDWSSHRRTLSIDSQAGAKIKLRLLDYPGWTMRIDGTKSPILLAQDGRILAQVPPGRHLLRLDFENTWWRKLATGLSLLTLAGLLGLSCWRLFHREAAR